MASVLEPDELAAVAHDRTAFNLAVWDKVVANPEFQAMPWRFETDAHGQIIMSPPPAPRHGRAEIRVAFLLRDHAPPGEIASECPISTSKGVKTPDVIWCSAEIWRESEGRSCLLRAPEICIEILSPSNTTGEIDEKRFLYFEAGAREVWLCSEQGRVAFFTPEGPVDTSPLCPGFPDHVS